MTGQGATVRVEPDGDLVWVVLDRPEVLNAMSGRVRDELRDALDAVAAGPWRCLVLRGEGRAFSSGADLGAYLDEVDVTRPDEIRAFLGAWNDVIRGIRELPVPSVAAVHGAAYGGGLNLALACDVVVAARSARLCQSYVSIGASIDLGGSWVLPRLVGLARARHLALTGTVIDADEALRSGLVAAVVEDDELLTAAREVAATIAASDPTAVAVTRRLLDGSADLGLDGALEAEVDGIVEVVAGPTFRRAVARFEQSRRHREGDEAGPT